MSYQLYDYGASIRFVYEGGPDIYIMKQSIRKIAVVREDVIIMDIINRSAIYFRRMETGLPSSVSAENLVNILNGWIENCLCNQNGGSGEGPAE